MSGKHTVEAPSKNPDGCHTGSFFILLTTGILMALLGLLAITGWVIGRPLLASFGRGLIPMAPATAVLFILFGLSVCCRALAPLSVRTFQISVVVGCLAGLVAFLLLVLSCFNIHNSFEHFGLNIAESVGIVHTGHMSPVTSFCFLLASVSFLASIPRTVFRRWRINLALGSAGVLFGICFIFLLPYLFGSPLLYGGTFIPPAFSTILAFTMLGLALMILDRRVRGFFDGSPAGNPITAFHFIMIFLFLATGIVVVGNTYYKDIENDYSREVGRKLSALAELKVGELAQWRKERFMDGSVIFKNQSFSTLVRRFFEKPADEDAQRQLMDWLGKYPTSGIYNQVRLFDAQGGCRLVLPAGQAEPSSIIVKNAAEVQRSGKMFIQDFYRNDKDQRIYLALMIPVLDASDIEHPLGVLVMRIDPMSYLYPLIQHWPTSSLTAETQLLRKEGNDVLFLNDLRHRGDAALTMRFQLERANIFAVKVALGQTGIMPGMDYRGVPVLAAAQAVPDSPWFLVAKMDTAEIQEPLRKQFWQILVLVGVMLFGAGTTVALLWRQQRVQLFREKAKTTELLRASEVQYRRLFEAARDGILILDAETGMVVDVNPFLVELLGVSREVFLGRKIWELGFFKDILANQAKFSELQQQGYVRYEDMALEGGDGKRHEVEFVSNVYLVNQKKVVQCNIRDISERKQMEKIQTFMAQSSSGTSKEPFFNALARYLAQNLQMDFVCIDRLEGDGLNARTVAVWCDGQFEDNVTYALKDTPCGDVVGKMVCCFPASVCQFFPRDQVLKDLRAESYVGVTLWSHAGRPIGLIAVIGRTPMANRPLAESILKFVAVRAASELERLESEDSLRKSEERYSMTISAVNDGIWDWHIPSGNAFFSPLYYAILGYANGEFAATYNSWRLLVHPEDIGNAECELRKSVETGEGFSIDLRMKGKTGEWIWVSTRGNATELGADGKAVRMVGTLSDITDRKRLEVERAKLEEQNRQLQKVESLGRMAGAIAHTFNNQLHVVEGYLEIVIGYLPPGDPCIAKLKTAMQAARKASAVSSLLITYLGQKPVKLESLDLSELCRTSLPVFQAGKPETVIMETDLPAPGPVISADLKQIQLLLTNLVINAWEAIVEDTGTIRLSVRTVSKSDIPLSHRFPLEWRPQEQHYACLEVTDSGCGIHENDIDKIFDPFFSTKFTGRGLGLSVVMGIMKTHKLLVTVENRTDGGVVFSVFFPISEDAAALQSEQVSKVPEIVPGGTILLVEDEPDVRKMTASMLDSFGFTVIQAKDGVEAVEIFGQHKDEISCLLSDLTMPRMGGWETISAIRAIRHDLPVILASGYDEASVMEGEHAEMPDFFLNKPYAMKKLGDAVCNAIANKDPAAPKRAEK